MKVRIALLVLIAGVVLTLYWTGGYSYLTPERIREAVLGMGPLGPVLFVLAFALLEPLHVPGVLFLVTAPMTWPLPIAFLLSLAGGTGAGIVGFVMARYIARDWVQERLPQSWRAYDERLATHGFRTVALIRLITFLAPAAHWVIGLSKVRFLPAVAGTAVGLIPGVLLFTLIGASLFAWLEAVSRDVWLGLLVAVLAFVLFRRRRRRSRAEVEDPEAPVPDASGSG